MVGRPQKYDSELRNISIAIPQNVKDYITELSRENKLSRNELIIQMIIQADKDLVKKQINTMKILRQSIKHYNSILDNVKEVNTKMRDHNEELANKMKSLSSCTYSFTIDQDILDFFDKRYKHKKHPLIDTKEQADALYNIYEGYCIDKHKIIKNKAIVKANIRYWIRSRK